MRRKRLGVDEPHEDTHRWLVSYADFITLLFAFFVVMYSISQVNEGKYKVVSDALVEVFRNRPSVQDPAALTTGQSSGVIAQSGAPPDIALLEGSATEDANVIDHPSAASAQQEELSLPSDTPPSDTEKKQFARTYAGVSAALREQIAQGQIEIRGSENWIEVDIRSGLLFDSGSDLLNVSAEPVLRALATELAKNDYLLRIRGYTDDQPIDTARFPSNWELSSSRAVTVVRMLQRNSIGPARMAVEGYAQFAPIGANADEAGRARNRRVVVAISRFQQAPRKDAAPAGPVPEGSGDTTAPVSPEGGAATPTSGATPPSAYNGKSLPLKAVVRAGGGVDLRGDAAQDAVVAQAPAGESSRRQFPGE